jgi:hypothetical protein
MQNFGEETSRLWEASLIAAANLLLVGLKGCVNVEVFQHTT